MAPPRPLTHFAGRLALVTGAASGIGEAIALELSRRGARLALVDIDGERLQRVAEQARARGAETHTYTVDIADAAGVAHLAEHMTREHGDVDVLVNNAGVCVAAPFATTSLEDLEWICGVNVWGPLRLTRALLPGMVRRGSGHVVIVASLAGLVGTPGMVAYSATKFAMVGFAEALRVDLAGTGVGVTAVCPGYVRTNLARATRYGAEGLRNFLEKAPSWYGMTKEKVARTTCDAVLRDEPLVVLGPERVGWWAKRIAPRAAFALSSLVARTTGIVSR